MFVIESAYLEKSREVKPLQLRRNSGLRFIIRKT